MKDTTLAIIAGGQARRLGGRVKSQIEVGGRTVLSRLLELAAGSPVLVVTFQPEAFPGLRCVADVEPGRGAPGGVVTALLSASTPWVLAVAQDMPGLKPEHAQALVAARHANPDADVIVAERDGQPEPLCALYRTSLGPTWRASLAENPSLRALIASRVSVRVALDPAALENINTPDDLLRLGAR